MNAPPIAKPEGKRLRRKLQKIGTQQRNHQTNYPEVKKTAFGGFHHKTAAVQPIGGPASHGTVNSSSRPCLPLPADLGDGKWLEQLRKSGYLCREDRSSNAQDSPSRRPTQSIPEFAHLSISDANSRTSRHRSADSLPSTPGSAHSGPRRYAKTPVYCIGQLESPKIPVRGRSKAHRVSSVELIAESYRALLESRCSLLEDSVPEPSPLCLDEHYEDDPSPTDYGFSSHPLETVAEVPENLALTGSPTSDDGTLVAFEEDAIYFKPISFTPEPSSPTQSYEEPEAVPTPVSPPEDPSLQICCDLLTRELSSAVSGSPVRPSAETSALQIWVMIEAYEKLRDQVSDMRLESRQAGLVEAMFDMWLGALYAIHDKMTGRDGRASESDYGELEPEDLD